MNTPTTAKSQPETEVSMALCIGDKTHWGEIVAVQWVGERYYFIMGSTWGISMMPSDE